MGIPLLLHRVLVRGYEPGEEADNWWREFERLHPTWSCRTWRDPIDPADFELGRLFESCTSGAQLADLLRLEILWKHGGVYVDSDVEPLQPLDPLTALDFFAGTEDGVNIGTAVIGAASGHPALRALIDRLLELDVLPDDVPPNRITGPALFGRVLGGRDDIVVLPPELFFPYNPSLGTSRSDVQSRRRAICAHHWHGSWRSESTGPSGPRRLGDVSGALRSRVKRAVQTVAQNLSTSTAEPSSGTYGTYVGQNRVLVSTIDGFSLHVIANDLSVTPELVAEGWYDPRLLGFFEQVLRPGDWVADVGANVGLFSLAAARRVGRWGRVLAFEADPELADLCRDNASMNWLENTEVHAAAVGAHSGGAILARHRRHRGLSVAYMPGDSGTTTNGDEDRLEVPLVSLDESIPPAVPIRLVKIDVEGGEAAVLRGMSRLADGRQLDYIVLEVKRRNAGDSWSFLLDTLRGYVHDYGAHLFSLGRQGDLRPTTVQEVALLESLPQLVVDFTRG